MAELSNFQFIWENWVVPLAKDLYKQADPDFVSKADLKERDTKNIAKKAEVYFKEKRKELKKSFYGKNYERSSCYMDFHKLSAVLCSTLMKYKIFCFNIDACRIMVEEIDKNNIDWLVKNALINFRLAFFASVAFLYQSMLFKYHEQDADLYNKLKNSNSLNLYEGHNKNVLSEAQKSTNNNLKVHESFENSVVLDLAKRSVNHQSFDMLLYSTIMYQLEEYNKLYYAYMAGRL